MNAPRPIPTAGSARSAARRRPRRWLSAVLVAALAPATLARGEEPPKPAPAPSPAPGAPGAPPPAPPPVPPGPRPGGSLEGGPPPGSPEGVPGPMTPERRAWRESMWPAATAEGWRKPVLITWQRTWDDAVAVSKETGKPILICINMDGEIASEHYAGVRYRSPEIAPLYEPYVCVIASVYRHNPLDYDDQGRRIPCPRFGGVTCGEHIAIEPIIYEKYCEGRRIAPRHIMVELDGKESYDVYYANDTASVFQAIKDGISKRAVTPPPPPVRGDRPIVERVESRDVADRAAVEAAYLAADAGTRRALLEAAVKHPEAAPLDLLRLGVFGLDADASRLARQALAKVDDPNATTLLADALRVPMAPAERDALVEALRRLGPKSPLARWLAVVHTGLGAGPGTPGLAPLPAAAAGSVPAARLWGDFDALENHLEEGMKAAKAAAKPDPDATLDLAETALAIAVEAPRAYGHDAFRARLTSKHMYAEARRLGLEAEKAGAKGWRVDAVVGLAAYYRGDRDEGFARATAAIPALPPDDGSWASMATLGVFAEGRYLAIKRSVKEKTDFPPSWLADVHAAYGRLLRHPLGTEEQVLWHYDLLDWLGATDQAIEILQAGLGRFRGSALLHERLREYALKKQGPKGLEAVYRRMLEAPDAPKDLAWFAGAASVAAADSLRRARDTDEAIAAYGRGIALFDRAAKDSPAAQDASDAAAALAVASRARVHLELGRLDAAFEDVLESLRRHSASAGTKDGVGITPGETATALVARLRAEKKDDLAAKVEAALAPIDPELLRPDRGD